MATKRCTGQDLLEAARAQGLAAEGYADPATALDWRRCVTKALFDASNFAGCEIIDRDGKGWVLDFSIGVSPEVAEERRLLSLDDFTLSAVAVDRINPVVEVRYARAANYTGGIPPVRYFSYEPEDFSAVSAETSLTLEERELDIQGMYSLVGFTPRFYTAGASLPVEGVEVTASTLRPGAQIRVMDGEVQIVSVNAAGGTEGALLTGRNEFTMEWTVEAGYRRVRLAQTVVLSLTATDSPSRLVGQGKVYYVTEVTGGSPGQQCRWPQLTVEGYLSLPYGGVSLNSTGTRLYGSTSLEGRVPYAETGGTAEFPVTLQDTYQGVARDSYEGAFVDFIGPYVEGVPMTGRGENAWGGGRAYPGGAGFLNYLSGGDSRERDYEYYAVRRKIVAESP